MSLRIKPFVIIFIIYTTVVEPNQASLHIVIRPLMKIATIIVRPHPFYRRRRRGRRDADRRRPNSSVEFQVDHDPLFVGFFFISSIRILHRIIQIPELQTSGLDFNVFKYRNKRRNPNFQRLAAETFLQNLTQANFLSLTLCILPIAPFHA